MKDKCLKRVIELYFKDLTVEQAISQVKKECDCKKCKLNCSCTENVNIVQEQTPEGQYKIIF
ncbi:hypothetical protein [Fusobacterium varium]